MKVILQQDVARIGRRHEMVEVPDGYALNQLIPKGLAIAATKQNQKQKAAKLDKVAAVADEAMSQFATACAALAAEPLQLSGNADEQGHLYAALHEADIVAAAAEKGYSITEGMVHIAIPIKAVGDHEVTLAYQGESRPITVTVSAT
jgi:large subunit ribosomal protein L9